MESCGDGEWRGYRCFTCPPRRGFFCPLVNLRPDTRVMSQCVGVLGAAGASHGNRKIPADHIATSTWMHLYYMSSLQLCRFQLGRQRIKVFVMTRLRRTLEIGRVSRATRTPVILMPPSLACLLSVMCLIHSSWIVVYYRMKTLLLSLQHSRSRGILGI